jgi:hypothetical protein
MTETAAAAATAAVLFRPRMGGRGRCLRCNLVAGWGKIIRKQRRFHLEVHLDRLVGVGGDERMFGRLRRSHRDKGGWVKRFESEEYKLESFKTAESIIGLRSSLSTQIAPLRDVPSESCHFKLSSSCQQFAFTGAAFHQ